MDVNIMLRTITYLLISSHVSCLTSKGHGEGSLIWSVMKNTGNTIPVKWPIALPSYIMLVTHAYSHKGNHVKVTFDVLP